MSLTHIFHHTSQFINVVIIKNGSYFRNKKAAYMYVSSSYNITVVTAIHVLHKLITGSEGVIKLAMKSTLTKVHQIHQEQLIDTDGICYHEGGNYEIVNILFYLIVRECGILRAHIYCF